MPKQLSGELYDGRYGTHPLDKQDTQATTPEFSGKACAHCGADLQKGVEVYEYEGVENDIHLCSVGCLAIFCTKFEADIDEFYKVIMD